MFRLVWARVWLDRRRSLAAFLTVLFAVTSFVVLSGMATTQRLEATFTAEAAFRSVYDILVRPTGARNEFEVETGRVRPNFISETYGGITLEQWQEIAELPGIEVAAPIATVGMIFGTAYVPIDLTDYVAESGTQLLRISMETLSRGNVLPARSAYLYVTDNQFLPQQPIQVTGSIPIPGIESPWTIGWSGPTEVLGENQYGFPCLPLVPQTRLDEITFVDRSVTPFDAPAWDQFCVSRAEAAASDYVVEIPVAVPLLIAAIDPAAEAALVGLDKAVVAGDYLAEPGGLRLRPLNRDWTDIPLEWPVAPALLAGTSSPVDVRLEVAVEELGAETIAEMHQLDPLIPWTVGKSDLLEIIANASQVSSVQLADVSLADVYADFVSRISLTSAARESDWETMTDVPEFINWHRQAPNEIWACTVLRPTPVVFNTDLAPQIVAESRHPGFGVFQPTSNLLCPPTMDWVSGMGGSYSSTFFPVAGSVADTAYRGIRLFGVHGSGVLAFEVVGLFEPGLTGAGDIAEAVRDNQAPLETYEQQIIYAADDATRERVQRDRVLPNLSPTDYLMPAPSLLINLADISIASNRFLPRDFEIDWVAPITAIRVRVAGVTGMDEHSLAQVQLAAQRIFDATGLDVDVMVASALAEQPVTLTQIENRPDLHVIEHWTQIGAVTAVVAAVDQKSVFLFMLIIASSALTIATVASAAASAQRSDLGTLSAVGFSPWRIIGLLTCQQATIGLSAGMLGALVAWPVAALLGVGLNAWNTLAAIPVATLLAVLAGLPTALHAAVARPTTLLRPPIRAARRRSRLGSSVIGIGINSIVRRPLRLLRGALAIAIAVGAVASLLVIMWTFHGAVAGTLLGQGIIAQVRMADIIAAIVLSVLGLLCLTMTLRFAHLEDASDWAVLSAVGWSPLRLLRAVVAQGATVGLVGALLGAALAFGAITALTGDASTTYLRPILLVAGIAAGACTLTALIPASALARTTITRFLSES